MKADAEKAAFAAAIAENPYDETTRKVFADWLEEHGFDDEAILQREWTAEKHREAERFMDRYASLLRADDHNNMPVGAKNALTVATLLATAHDFLDGGEETIFVGLDTSNALCDQDEEFWQHFMVLTGRPVPVERRDVAFVCCSC